MKIAVAGKGGSGKTTVAGTLARLLGRRGEAVLAIDADPNPNLAITLGLPREAVAQIEPVPQTIMEERLDVSGKKFRVLAVPYQDVIAHFGVRAPDNTTLLVMGRVHQAGVG